MLTKLLVLVFVVGACMFWWRSRAVAERAKVVVKHRCQQLNLQLLDDSVALSRMWLSRSLTGRLQVCREFSFDFSSDGVNRLTGSLQVFGHETHRIDLPPYPES